MEFLNEPAKLRELLQKLKSRFSFSDLSALRPENSDDYQFFSLSSPATVLSRRYN